ncbi:S-layer homology domain-containing protein [Paenibacillus sp. GYB003]|uniref:S-layer homology domain-containing protein n=1 Tax=Paenibacillus sp. GYB003 TaxID=2994392 RepID=UPI002F96DA55
MALSLAVRKWITAVTAISLLFALCLPAGAWGAEQARPEMEAQSAGASVSGFVYEVSGDRISFSQDVTKWASSPDGRYLYAVSNAGRKLLYIDTADFTVKRDVTLHSRPSDIKYAEGNLYISLPDEKKISVVDTAYGTSVKGNVYQVASAKAPSRFAVGGSFIYYTDAGELRKLDMRSGTDDKMTIPGHEQAQSHFVWNDPAEPALYVGTDAGTFKLDPSTGEVAASNPGLLFYGGDPVKFGDTIYWGMLSVSAADLQIIGGNEGFAIYADSIYRFADKAVYDRQTGALVSEYDQASFLHVRSGGSMFVYYTDLKQLRKYDSLDSLKLENPAGRIPVSLARYPSFFDNDFYWGTIAGILTWSMAADERYIDDYVVYYMDDAGNKIGSAIAVVPKTAAREYQIPKGTVLPDNAAGFAIYSRNGFGESERYTSFPISDSVFDYSAGIDNLHIEDANPLRGTIDLQMVWKETRPNPKYAALEAYYADSFGQPLPKKAGTAALNKTTDRQTLSLGKPADGSAKHVVVKIKRKDGSYDSKEYYFSIADNVADEPVSAAVGAPGAPADVGWGGVVFFLDTDPEAGYAGGRLQWLHPYGWSGSVASYIAYFLNENDERIRPILETSTADFRKEFGSFGDYLPFMNDHTAIPDGAAKIGVFAKNEHGESATGLIRSLWDAPYAKPARVRFVDENPNRGAIEPKLTWTPDSEETGIVNYRALFFGETMNMLESNVFEADRDTYPYEMKFDIADIPAQASFIGVMPVNRFGEWPMDDPRMFMAPISDDVSASIPEQIPTNATLPNSGYLAFGDEDGDVGEIGGVLQWSESWGISGYNVYFLDRDGKKVGGILSAKSKAFGIAHIPMNTRIPQNAAQLGIYAWNGSEESVPTTTPIYDKKYSDTLQSWQVSAVYDPLEKLVAISVNGLTAGDTIKVFANDTIPYPIAARVSDGQSVTIKISSFENRSRLIYVTITKEGYLESTRLVKTFSIPDGGGIGNPGTENPGTGNPGTENPGTGNPGTENPGTGNPGTENPGTGNPGTGNPGTGNPGTGSPGTGNPGTGTPGAAGPVGGGGSPSTPQQPAASGSYVPETRSESANGKTYAVAELDAAKLAEAFKQSPQPNKAVVDLKDAENAKVRIPAGALANAASASADSIVTIKKGGVAYDLPVGLFDVQAIAGRLGIDPKDVHITVTMEQVTGAAARQITSRAERDGVTLLTAPVEFTITVGSGGKQDSVNDFGSTFVTRSFTLTQTVESSRATAVRIDPVTGEMHFVPAVFATTNGRTEVRMMRQGNSVYAVAETKPRTFADLQGHWAKADIELLASKLIVRGATADAFMPDRSITRAEFAALLVRSLGIADAKSGGARFADVPEGAWFAGAVAAAADKGLVSGTDDRQFRPDEPVTREQMALMIARALAMTGKKGGGQADVLTRFADRASVSDWAEAAVSQVVQAGLMNGVDDGRFAPAEQASRAQVAVMLKRMLQHVGFMN